MYARLDAVIAALAATPTNRKVPKSVVLPSLEALALMVVNSSLDELLIMAKPALDAVFNFKVSSTCYPALSCPFYNFFVVYFLFGLYVFISLSRT